MANRQIQRNDTAANWASVNPVLARSEFGHEYDTGKWKLGDGVTAWNSLAYFTLHPSVSYTELGYLDGVTSAIQTQLNGKQATLVSGTDIKTINGTSLLGSGNLVIDSGASISDVIVYAIALGG